MKVTANFTTDMNIMNTNEITEKMNSYLNAKRAYESLRDSTMKAIAAYLKATKAFMTAREIRSKFGIPTNVFSGCVMFGSYGISARGKEVITTYVNPDNPLDYIRTQKTVCEYYVC